MVQFVFYSYKDGKKEVIFSLSVHFLRELGILENIDA